MIATSNAFRVMANLDADQLNSNFNEASIYTTGELQFFIGVVLFVLVMIYASVSSINLSMQAVQRGEIGTLLIGLALVGCIVIIILSII